MKEARKTELFNILKEFKQDGLTANQYDLEEMSEGNIKAQEWSELLREPDVQKYIRNEMEVIRAAEVNKMVHQAADSRSVGQSQLINALSKLEEDDNQDHGPAFIYSYIPLTEEQKHAQNVIPFNISKDAPQSLEDLQLQGFNYNKAELEEIDE